MDKVYEKLKAQLASMTDEERQAEWEKLKEYNKIGPTVTEYFDNLMAMRILVPADLQLSDKPAPNNTFFRLRNNLLISKDDLATMIIEFKKFERFGRIWDDDLREDINLSEISHRILGVEFDGENIRVDIEILDTPKGQIAKRMLKLNRGFKVVPHIVGYPEKINNELVMIGECMLFKLTNIISFDIKFETK